MANPTSLQPIPKRGSAGRKIVIVIGVFFALLAILYFVVSSGTFITSVVLPRVGKIIHADVSAESASFSPFSRLTLRNARVKTTGAEPLFAAEEVRVRYRLLPFLKGNVEVEEVWVQSPVINLIEEEDGATNLDPLLRKDGESKPESGKDSSPPQILARNVAVKNGTVKRLQKRKDGGSTLLQMTGLEVSLDEFGNGRSGKAGIKTALLLQERGPTARAAGAAAGDGVLGAALEGDFQFAVDEALLPRTAQGTSRLDVTRAEGSFQELAGLGGVLQADMTPSEIRQLALRFQRSGANLGQVLVSGPLDLAKTEARLRVEVQSIDRAVLNLAGAAQGWDFGNSTINATNVIDVAQRGAVIGASGKVRGSQLSIRQKQQTTPIVDLEVEYQFNVNLTEKTMMMQKLNVLGTQRGGELLKASLDIPMNLTWGSTVRGFTESNFQLAITQLNLDEWKSVFGGDIPSGLFNLKLAVRAQDDGKKLEANLQGGIRNLAVRFGTNSLAQAELGFSARSLTEDFKIINLSAFDFNLSQLNKPLVKGNGSARYHLGNQELNLEIRSEGAAPALLQQFPVPTLQASQGTVQVGLNYASKGNNQKVTGTAVLDGFTGRYGEYQFRNFQAATDYYLALALQQVQIHRAGVAFKSGFDSGGSMDVTGKYDLEKGSGAFTFRAVDLNQNLFQTFLAPSLGKNKLLSISVNGKGSADYDPRGESSIKADFALSNWVVQDPQKRVQNKPLEVNLQLDSGIRGERLDLRQILLSLSQTARARNQLQIKGLLDFSPTNAAPSHLAVSSAGLDLTPFYDLFANPEGDETKKAPAPRTGGGQSEPAAVRLPFKQMTAKIDIGQLYLREIAISNFVASAGMNAGEVTLKPMQMMLNGAPVKADALLNLAIPGYRYDVSFQADQVPLEPIASTFATNSAGQLRGDLSAQGRVKGAGVTGVNLKKNLEGQFSLNMTNMNYEIVGRKIKRIMEPIAFALRVPELTLTPINWVHAQTQVGQGRIDLSQFTVQSQAFSAQGQGAAPIADVFTNSPLRIPVSLALRRSLAEKANLVPGDAPTNTTYVSLPSFVTLEGTIGEPETKIDKLVIAGLLARTVGGIPQLVGDKAGNILQNLGNVLSGQKAPAPGVNSPATNAPNPRVAPPLNPTPVPSTNKPPRFRATDLLDLLPKK